MTRKLTDEQGRTCTYSVSCYRERRPRPLSREPRTYLVIAALAGLSVGLAFGHLSKHTQPAVLRSESCGADYPLE